MLESVEQALTDLGIPIAIITAIILPFLACALIALLRIAVLSAIRRRVRRTRRFRRWRAATSYIAVIAGLAIFQSMWLASVKQIAAWIADIAGVDDQALTERIVTGLGILLATAALVLAVVGLRALHRIAVVRLRAWSMRTRSIRIQRLELFKTSQLRNLVDRTLKIEHALLLTGGVFLYAFYILSIFPTTARIGLALLESTGAVALRIVLSIVDYLPNLIYLLVIWVFVLYSIKVVKFLLEAIEKKRLRVPNFDPEWADPTYKLARAILLVFAIVISYPFLPGAQSEVFQAFSVFLGALLTLGSTAVVGNMISGVVLTYTGAFHLGDRVRIGETTGDVLEKTLFVTRLRTVENETVSIPNGVVLTGSITNYNKMAKRGGLILRIPVGIGYDVPWQQVHEILEAAAGATNRIVSFPKPTVWELSLDDYAVTYELRAATDRPSRLGDTRAELHRNVLDAFHEAGIEIMTPSVYSVRDGSAPALPNSNGTSSKSRSNIKDELGRIQQAFRADRDTTPA